MDLYMNAEVEFEFEVLNPIVQKGGIRIHYPSDNTIKWDAAVSFDQSKTLIRCFDQTCSDSKAVISHNSGGHYVEIRGMF